MATQGGGRRWLARAALAAAVAALVVPLLIAGWRSVLLLAVGVVGMGVVAAALWWALAHLRTARVAGLGFAGLVFLAVLVIYVRAHFLWVVVLSVALLGLAGSAARAALRADARMPEHDGPQPRQPFLIMNPRSGGGKVGRFDLVSKAEAAGATVYLLDGPEPIDVAALARRAAADGADLLGVAGGDGTQALVAGVAADLGLPFLVISAGTRNHFALDLGLDRADPSRCLDALTDGVELTVDLGECNDRPFVNNASFGAYAEVVRSPQYRADKARTTVRALPDLLTGHAGAQLSVRAGAATVAGPQAVLVSNNSYDVGDLAGLGRRPRLDLATLGLVGVRIDRARQAAGLVRGTAAHGLTVTTAPEITVSADSAEIPVGVDGESLLLATPVRCRIRPGVLRVRVPRDRPGRRPRPSVDWHGIWRLAAGHGMEPGKSAVSADHPVPTTPQP